MPTFRWIGRTLQGQQVSGDLDAPSKEEAAKRLAQREIVVMSLDERATRGGEPADPDRAMARPAPQGTSTKEKPRPLRGLLFALVLVAAAFGVGVWAPVVSYDCERSSAGIVNCVVHESVWGVVSLRDQSIANSHNTAGMPGDILFVGDDDDGISMPRQIFEQSHDFDARFRIEISGRFIRQNDRRAIYQRTCNGDALSLATG